MPDVGPQVPFLELGPTYLELQSDLDAAYRRVMDRGWFVLGSEVAAFEEEFASSAGVRRCVGVASGLDALELALRSLGLGVGDEVVVPSNTYIATWLAVTAVGAVPVPVEPDPATHNLDAARVAEAITDRTGALLPVHLYGRPADGGAIVELGRSLGIPVVADAAQAHGATVAGEPIGALGDIVCWSFYPGKNLGAFGDAGAITTMSNTLADRVVMLRNYGSTVKYVNDEVGVNSRLDELQAAFLRVKLSRLPEWNDRRRRIAERYRGEIAWHEGLVAPPPDVPGDVVSSWHLFVVRSDMRDALQASLAGAGVQTLIHYPIPPHRQAAYRDLPITCDLPIAERLAGEVLSLPMGPHLSDADVTAVISAVNRFAG